MACGARLLAHQEANALGKPQVSLQRLAETEDRLQVLLAKCGARANVGAGELRGIVASLRERAAEVRTDAERARARHCAGGENLLQLAAQVDREQHLSGQASAEVADEAAKVAALERRLGSLQLEEGERRREVELGALRTQLSLEKLAARAAEAERQQAETALHAASAAGSLPALRAGIAAEERRLEDLREQYTKVSAQVAGATPRDELQHYEWYRMLIEDRPDLLALSVVETDCAKWEARLHDVLAPLAFREPPKSEGVVRLEAELETIGAAERAKRASCVECFRRVQAQDDGGPWGAVVGELQLAYEVIVALRSSSDALSGEIASCRWQRTGAGAAASSLVDQLPAPTRAPSREVVTQPQAHMPRGPRFHAPVLVRPKAKSPVGEEPPGSSGGMLQAVVTDANEWEAGLREAPTRVEKEKGGLAFLHNASSQRFRPSTPASMGFDASVWGEEDSAAAMASFERSFQAPPAQPPDRPLPPPPTRGDLARQVAAAFREPLSSALGTRPPLARSVPALAGAERPRQRMEWVTFEAARAQPRVGGRPVGDFAAASPGSL